MVTVVILHYRAVSQTTPSYEKVEADIQFNNIEVRLIKEILQSLVIKNCKEFETYLLL